MGRAGGRSGGGASRSPSRAGSSHSFSGSRSGSSYSFGSRPAGRSGGSFSSVSRTSHRASAPVTTPKTDSRPKVSSGRINQTGPKPRPYEESRRREPIYQMPSVPPSVYTPPRTVVHRTVVYEKPNAAYTERERPENYAGGKDPELTEEMLSAARMYEAKSKARFWKTACLTGLVLMLLFFALFAVSLSKDAAPANLTNREKLDLPYGYATETLTDELGWIRDPAALNHNLKGFYEETGAVPYIALVSRPEVTAEGMDAEKEYADAWYSENLDHEGYVLLMYFDSGIDGLDGNAHLSIGRQAAVLMDAEAQDIFWDYLDYYWGMDPEDMPEDELFANVFSDTGKRIMEQRTEGTDVAKALFLFLAVCAAGVTVGMILKWKRESEAAKAAETARILEAGKKDLAEDTMAGSAETEDLLQKYGGKQESE